MISPQELIGAQPISLKGIYYLVDGEHIFDSLELILKNKESILFTSSTGWTLRLSAGSWPELPSWCFPKESWKFLDIDSVIGATTWNSISSVDEIPDEMGEFIGVDINFEGGSLKIMSGDSINYEIRH